MIRGTPFHNFGKKSDAVGIAVWIISLGLSKVFDRVRWPALWTASVDEGMLVHLVHLVWTLQYAYFAQCGEVMGDMGQRRTTNITGSVRHGNGGPRLELWVSTWTSW